jgi:hypothetical protein
MKIHKKQSDRMAAKTQIYFDVRGQSCTAYATMMNGS